MKNVIFTLFSIFILAACASNKLVLMSPPQNDSNSDSFWETADIEETGLSEKAAIDHLELCKKTGADSQLIIYNNKIVSEWYSDRYSEPIGAMSSTKVVSSLLVGILADMGKLHYQDKVTEIIPEWSGQYRDEVRIVDLLTHSAGFEQRVDNTSIGFSPGNKSEFVLSLKPDYEPGKKFSYSNEGVQLLEPIISSVAGMSTQDFADEYLFDKLGMKNTHFYSYGGSPWLYSELQTTPRDMARLGILMKNTGIWKGQKIVSEDYILKATVSSPLNKEMGYLWWILDENVTVKGYYASGYLDTDIFVFTDYDVVIVRTQMPKNGFSGKQESKDYFMKAMPIFRRLVRDL